MRHGCSSAVKCVKSAFHVQGSQVEKNTHMTRDMTQDSAVVLSCSFYQGQVTSNCKKCIRALNIIQIQNKHRR